MRVTDIPPKVREIVKARDRNRCIYCGTPYMLQIAHIFYNRSHGGLGVKENLVTLCIEHHCALDNGKLEKAKPIKDYCENYLHAHYEIDLDKLKFKKGQE